MMKTAETRGQKSAEAAEVAERQPFFDFSPRLSVRAVET